MSMSVWWAIPLTAWAGFLALHVVVWRLAPARGIIGLWPLCGLAVTAFGVVCGVQVLTGDQLPGAAYWFMVPVFGGLVVSHLYFYYGILRSVSVRLLGELIHVGGGPVTREALHQRYSSDDILRVRLGALLQAHWICESDGAYALTPTGRRVARLARALKRIYRMTVSG